MGDEVDDLLEAIAATEEGMRAATGSDVLAKASTDNFDYAIGLVDGSVFRFCEARLVKGSLMIDLHDARRVSPTDHDEDLCVYPRGVEVRISSIIWATDAPMGS